MKLHLNHVFTLCLIVVCINVSCAKEPATPNDTLSRTKELLPQSPGQVVNHTYYSLAYAEEHEQPYWVFYQLTNKMLLGSTSRTDNFRLDPFVETVSATLSDYKGSGYDRGHLCPAGDMTTNKVAMSESFYMSNMSPQNPSFNRGVWKSLESTVRNWAEDEKEIFVATGPVFSNNISSIGDGVTVPGSYYKVIFDSTKDKKMIGFILPNKKGEKQLEEYTVTVDYVESVTGIDFFAGLPDVIENELEANSDDNLWEFNSYHASTTKSAAIQCKGIASSTGVQCKNKTTNENGYCHHHQSQAQGGEKKETERLNTPVQCKGTTQKGSRCKNKTLNANGYCHVHQSQDGGTSQPKYTDTSSEGRCQARTKTGTQCKRSTALGSRYCWQHK